MGLIEFLAKMIRTHFFDATTKFQVNVEKPDKIDLLLKEIHTEEQTQKISFKSSKSFLLNNEDKEIRESGLL
jgi:hypothetical protein